MLVAAPEPRSYAPSGSSTGTATSIRYSSGVSIGAGAIAAAAAGEQADDALAEPDHVEQRRVSTDEQLGRNDPCWCGSGKKFKRCHGA